MRRYRMLVAHGHFMRYVLHNFHNGLHILSTHPKPGPEGVSQIVKLEPDLFIAFEVFQFGLFDRGPESFGQLGELSLLRPSC